MVKTHTSREQSCREDLDLLRTELSAAQSREAEAEKALRLNDCSAARRDLRTYRDTAEKYSIDVEVLKKRVIDLEPMANRLFDVEEQLQAEAELRKHAEQRLAEATASIASLTSELKATRMQAETELRAVHTICETEKSALQLSKDAELEAVKKNSRMELETAAASHASEIESINKMYHAELEATKRANSAELTSTKKALESELHATKKALQSELDASKKALESLLESLDTRRQYEALLKRHEKEWLPHWLAETVAAAGTSLVDVTTPVIAHIQSSARKFWYMHLWPLLAKTDAVLSSLPSVNSVRQSLAGRLVTGQKATKKTLYTVVQETKKYEAMVESAVIDRLRKVQGLESFAKPEIVHYVLWGAVTSLLVPIVYFVLKLLVENLIYWVRPGSAEISAEITGTVATTTTTFTTLPPLNTHFTSEENFKKAFNVDKDKRIAYLGTAVAHTLACEEIWSKPHVDEQTFVREVERAMSVAATQSGVRAYITPGPGARSAAVVKEKEEDLFLALLGAAFVDGGMDLGRAREVWRHSDNKGRESESDESSEGGMAAHGNGEKATTIDSNDVEEVEEEEEEE